MVRKLLTLPFLIPVCFIFACKSNAPDEPNEPAEYQKITAEQARNMMAENERFILLDVRTDEEFTARRIEGAVLIPDYEIEWRSELDLPDKRALILIYCRTGRRSANVAHLLIEMGYTRVYDFGGIETDWDADTVRGHD